MSFAEIIAGAGAGGVTSIGVHHWTTSRRRPVLEMRCGAEDHPSPFTRRGDDGEPYDYVFARPRVCGKNRKDSAHRVQVLLTGCRPRPPHVELLLGRPFKWSDVDANELDIPPGICRRFDLAHVRRPTNARAEEPLMLTLDVYPEPHDDHHRLPAARYELDLAIAAQDVATQFVRATVALLVSADGKPTLDVSVMPSGKRRR